MNKKYYPWLLLACMLIVGFDVKSSEWEITLGGWSNHMSETKDYNEVHDTLGIRYKWFELMTFENSFYKRSVLVAVHSQYKPTDWLSLGLRMGAASGYSEPWVVHPTMTVYYKAVGFEFGYLPTISKYTPDGVFTFSGKLRF